VSQRRCTPEIPDEFLDGRRLLAPLLAAISNEEPDGDSSVATAIFAYVGCGTVAATPAAPVAATNTIETVGGAGLLDALVSAADEARFTDAAIIAALITPTSLVLAVRNTGRNDAPGLLIADSFGSTEAAVAAAAVITTFLILAIGDAGRGLALELSVACMVFGALPTVAPTGIVATLSALTTGHTALRFLGRRCSRCWGGGVRLTVREEEGGYDQ